MIIWKGINFKDKGIIVEHTPKISKGKKRIETINIEGKSGFLTIDKGTYDAFLVSVECHIDTDKTSIEEVKSYLDGYGTISFDNETESTAIIQNAIQFTKVTNFKKFIIQFLVNPIFKSIDDYSKKITTTPSTLEISKATAIMYPYLKIVGSGDVSITINNRTFYLYSLDSSQTYILDCENKVIINNLGQNCSNKMKYDFPYLIPGINNISYTGSITQLEIEYKISYI